MALTDTTTPLDETLAPIVAGFAGDEDLVLLPDELTEIDGKSVAGFRQGSQELRVDAIEAGVSVAFARPDGAVAGQYSEHAATIVLPLVLIVAGIPAQVVGNLITNYLQGKLDERKQRGETQPATVRYREVTLGDDGATPTLREIEGPGSDVLEWLREERAAAKPALKAGSDDD